MQAREVIAFTAIKKSLLPQIDVKEAQERTERQALGESLEPAALSNPSALQLIGYLLIG